MSNVNNYIVYLEVFFFCFFSESIAQTIGQGNPFAIFQKDSLQQSKDIISNEEMFPPPLFPYLSNESHDLQGDVQVAWVNYYGVSCQPGFDEATAIAIDQLGNVYVTGYSPNELFGVDYLTIKYSPAGEEIWVKRYNNEENGNDKPCAISIDASGNVYVTGSSEFSGTSWDYVTVKYDSNGKEEWSARFNGIGNRDDMATAMDIDDEGNVYVTGNCRNATQYYDYDYATVKYNAAGVQQWIRRYAGSGNHDDRANALVVDRAGNVYVTGSCSYLDSNSDYTTIKYNSNGTEQWIARYNGKQMTVMKQML